MSAPGCMHRESAEAVPPAGYRPPARGSGRRGIGRVRERVLDGKRRARLVLGPDVHDVERMRGGLDVREVELGDLADRLEDRAELRLHGLDLPLGNLEPRQAGYVEYVFSSDRHVVSKSMTPKRTGPVGGPVKVVTRRSLVTASMWTFAGLEALGALLDLELHFLPLLERPVAVHLDLRMVDEHVVPALARNEAVALLVREPLDGALCQHFLLQQTNDGPRQAAVLSLQLRRDCSA